MVYTLYELEERRRHKWYMAAGVVCLTVLISASLVFLSRDLSNRGLISFIPRASKYILTPTPIALSTPTYAPVDNIPPGVSLISPKENTRFLFNSMIRIEAQATDNDRVQKVEFYANDLLRCRVKAPPYACDLKLDKPNTKFVIRAKAFDMFENDASTEVIVFSE